MITDAVPDEAKAGLPREMMGLGVMPCASGPPPVPLPPVPPVPVVPVLPASPPVPVAPPPAPPAPCEAVEVLADAPPPVPLESGGSPSSEQADRSESVPSARRSELDRRSEPKAMSFDLQGEALWGIVAKM
ncbi:hypothetical protein [Sorangium sp. So ce176]|uniref:hypothetical protein n=1 Tax=Sorangium sp. So ce176 TaxID=3133286 RepID=UPI003F5D621D